ncbi:inorganic diphosphatase [soil metagenome]
MQLPDTFSQDGKNINVVVDTPAGSPAKYNYDEKTGSFKLKKILPAGLVFPFHFGFVPHTLAEDGDPLDVLVLMDAPSWPGCIVECRIPGMLQATQTMRSKKVHNDRIIGVANASRKFKKIKSISDLDPYLMEEIINFLLSYTRLENKNFKITSKQGPEKAMALIKRLMADRD